MGFKKCCISYDMTGAEDDILSDDLPLQQDTEESFIEDTDVEDALDSD